MYLHLSLVLKLHNLFLLSQGSSPSADLERNTKNYLKSWYDDSSKQKIQCKVKKGWEKEREGERDREREVQELMGDQHLRMGGLEAEWNWKLRKRGGLMAETTVTTQRQ